MFWKFCCPGAAADVKEQGHGPRSGFRRHFGFLVATVQDPQFPYCTFSQSVSFGTNGYLSLYDRWLWQVVGIYLFLIIY